MSALHGYALSRRAMALLGLAVVCVAMLPAISRTGAELPHAPGFFQARLDPAAAFDGHGAATIVSATTHERLRVTGAIVTSRCDALVDYLAFTCVGGSSVFSPLPDVARVLPMAASGGSLDPILVVVFTSLLLLARWVRRWRSPRSMPIARGRNASPETPPPRQALVACLG